jgi:hypothetical protein
MPEGGETPQLQMDFELHWCHEHLHPLKAKWPKGAMGAMLGLVNAIMADERIIAAAPKDGDGQAQVTAMNAVLREHSPLCCFLGDEKVKEIMDEALAGHVYGIPHG